jgi:hypothetical protein
LLFLSRSHVFSPRSVSLTLRARFQSL